MRDFGLVSIVVALVACGSTQTQSVATKDHDAAAGSGTCRDGAETCHCYGNGTCNANLTCASNLCVSLGAPDASLGSSGGTGGRPGAGGAPSNGGASSMDGGGAASTGAGGQAGTGGKGGPGCIAQVSAGANQTAKHRYPTMSWASLMSAKGVVRFGGNAVDDCDALYDG